MVMDELMVVSVSNIFCSLSGTSRIPFPGFLVVGMSHITRSAMNCEHNM